MAVQVYLATADNSIPEVEFSKSFHREIITEWYVRFKDFLSEQEQKIISPNESGCLLYTSPSPRDRTRSRMPSSA